MKRIKYLWILLLLNLLVACESGSDIGQFDDVIIESESNQNKFKQITFTLNIVNEFNEYINTNLIDSVKLRVNGKEWGTFSSQAVDTSGRTDIIRNDIGYSYTKRSYLIIAPYVLETETLETAGDYVEYLDNRIVLSPGEYVCEISEVLIHDLENRWINLKPQVYKDFIVVENTSSSFVGDIYILIK